MKVKKKVHELLNDLEKMCSYLELESIKVSFDQTYYYISKDSVDKIHMINKMYNVKIRIIKE